MGNLFAAVFFFSSCKKKILSQLISQKIETHKLCCLFYISFLLSWLLRSFEFCHFSQLVLKHKWWKNMLLLYTISMFPGPLYHINRFVINISYLLKKFYYHYVVPIINNLVDPSGHWRMCSNLHIYVFSSCFSLSVRSW